MQVEVKLVTAATESKVIILTNRMTEEVHSLVQMLSDTEPKLIAGFREDTVTVLDEKDILKVYAANGKVYAVLPSGEYTLRLRLYEIEERLKPQHFVRISNSEIINLKKVKSFDLSFTGTICVILSDGSKTYASRRYVGIDLPLYAKDGNSIYLARGKADSDNYSWEDADPDGLNDYLCGKINGHEQLRRIICYIKKWRNEKYANPSSDHEVPPSIGLTLLLIQSNDAPKMHPDGWVWVHRLFV